MDENQTNGGLTAAREQVRHALQRLEEVQLDLWETVEGITLPPVQVREDGFDLAGLSEVDAVIRCAVHDHLEPLIRALRSLTRNPPEDRS